jgi:hypothetical protein
MPISNPGSPSSSSSDSPLQSSPSEGASQSEKSRKVDTSSSGTEARKTKSAVKGVHEGTAEHGKKEEGA